MRLVLVAFPTTAPLPRSPADGRRLRDRDRTARSCSLAQSVHFVPPVVMREMTQHMGSVGGFLLGAAPFVAPDAVGSPRAGLKNAFGHAPSTPTWIASRTCAPPRSGSGPCGSSSTPPAAGSTAFAFQLPGEGETVWAAFGLGDSLLGGSSLWSARCRWWPPSTVPPNSAGRPERLLSGHNRCGGPRNGWSAHTDLGESEPSGHRLHPLRTDSGLEEDDQQTVGGPDAESRPAEPGAVGRYPLWGSGHPNELGLVLRVVSAHPASNG